MITKPIEMSSKQKFPIILFVLFIGMFYQILEASSQTKLPQSQMQLIQIDANGDYLIKIWNFEKRKSYKLKQARKDAVLLYLYEGLSGNNESISQPPLLNSPELIEKFNQEYPRFSRSDIWIRSTSNSVLVYSKYEIINNKKCKVYIIRINRSNLKEILAKQGVIPHLSQGF